MNALDLEWPSSKLFGQLTLTLMYLHPTFIILKIVHEFPHHIPHCNYQKIFKTVNTDYMQAKINSCFYHHIISYFDGLNVIIPKR